MATKEQKLRDQRRRAAVSYKLVEAMGNNPQFKVVKRSKYGGPQLTAQPMSHAEQDHIKSNLKGMTTRGSGRKPSMPAMPWDKKDV